MGIVKPVLSLNEIYCSQWEGTLSGFYLTCKYVGHHWRGRLVAVGVNCIGGSWKGCCGGWPY
eukprot:3935471-Ditylum_brightwellii.AAC.1